MKRSAAVKPDGGLGAQPRSGGSPQGPSAGIHSRREPPDGTRQRELVRLARQARRRAHAPHSGFKVGAALRTAGGAIVTGCNIENASYGLTMCAERVAVFKAVSEGLGGFSDIAVVAASSRPTPPCGSCRQILWEFCGDIAVHIADVKGGAITTLRLSELLPLPFDSRNL